MTTVLLWIISSALWFNNFRLVHGWPRWIAFGFMAFALVMLGATIQRTRASR